MRENTKRGCLRLWGLNADDAEDLRAILFRDVKTNEVRPGRRDVYGQRYVIEFFLVMRGERIPILSGWIIEHGGDIPKLITCYPPLRKEASDVSPDETVRRSGAHR